MLHSLVLMWFTWVRDWGYAGVFILMALESTIVPVPSELVVPPAAYWAAQGGSMSLWGVILASTLGSYFGSALSFLVCRYLGQAYLHKYGKYVMLTQQKIRMAEKLVKDYGAAGIFFSRLLPVVRHLISMPAGLFNMNFKLFSIVTLLGAGFWCTILAFWGEKIIGAHPDLLESPDKMMGVIRAEMLTFVVSISVLLILYAGVVRFKKSLPSN